MPTLLSATLGGLSLSIGHVQTSSKEILLVIYNTVKLQKCREIQNLSIKVCTIIYSIASQMTTVMLCLHLDKCQYSRNCLNGHLCQPVTCFYGCLSVTPLRFHYLFDPAQWSLPNGQPCLHPNDHLRSKQCEQMTLLLVHMYTIFS